MDRTVRYQVPTLTFEAYSLVDTIPYQKSNSNGRTLARFLSGPHTCPELFDICTLYILLDWYVCAMLIQQHPLASKRIHRILSILRQPDPFSAALPRNQKPLTSIAQNITRASIFDCSKPFPAGLIQNIATRNLLNLCRECSSGQSFGIQQEPAY